MHWADPTSIEFVASLLANESFTAAGHVFISTSRQPLPQTLPQSLFVAVDLEKLSCEETTEFILNLFDQQKVSNAVLDLLVKRTDGIPLFIEELVNMLQQKQLVRHLNGVIDFTSPDKLAEVPNSLLDSLQQKLDTLVYAKETAQLAATIGREFNYDLLVAVSNRNDSQVQIDLNELVETEMVFLQRKVSGDSYIFKHALVRDAAYTSMGSKGRVAAHHSIARVMASGFADIADKNPAEVAAHFAGAECFEQAVDFAVKATDKQVRSSANDEAISIGEQALTWAYKVSNPDSAHLVELNIHRSMQPALMTLFGYGAQRVTDWVTRVKELTTSLQTVASPRDIQSTLDEMNSKCQWSEFLSAHYCSRRQEARKLGEELLTVFRQENRRQDEIVLRTHLGQAYNMDGDLILSMQTYESALALYDEKLDADMGLAYGMDPRVQALSLSGYNYLHMGQLAKAKENAYLALTYAEQIGNLGEIVFANIFVALYHVFLKEYEETAHIWRNYNRQHGAKGEIFYLYFFRCYCYSAQREPQLAEQAMQPQIDSGQVFAVGYYVTHVAEAYLDTGDIAAATRLMEEALQRSISNNERSVFPFLKKTLAQCYHQSDKKLSSRIKDLLTTSIDDAIEQKARYFELENQVYLAQLMDYDKMDTGEIDLEIEKLLAWFSEHHEGLTTPLYLKAQKRLCKQ
jgi:predicted ATPase